MNPAVISLLISAGLVLHMLTLPYAILISAEKMTVYSPEGFFFQLCVKDFCTCRNMKEYLSACDNILFFVYLAYFMSDTGSLGSKDLGLVGQNF